MRNQEELQEGRGSSTFDFFFGFFVALGALGAVFFGAPFFSMRDLESQSVAESFNNSCLPIKNFFGTLGDVFFQKL